MGNLSRDIGSPGREVQNCGMSNARAVYTTLLPDQAHDTALRQTEMAAALWHSGTEEQSSHCLYSIESEWGFKHSEGPHVYTQKRVCVCRFFTLFFRQGSQRVH